MPTEPAYADSILGCRASPAWHWSDNFGGPNRPGALILLGKSVDLGVEPLQALGNVRLKGLTPAHVRALYREKLDAGLTLATVRKIHSTLHKALSQAVSVTG